MNVNNTVTMVVGLVVGVLLIAGVVAPVIANVSSDNGGGGGLNPAYTNTGDMYFQIPDGQEHIIAIDYTGTSMQFKFDGTLLFEKPMGEDDRWVVPLNQSLYDGEYYTNYIMWDVSNSNMGMLLDTPKIMTAGASNSEFETYGGYTLNIGNFITIYTNYDGNTTTIAYDFSGEGDIGASDIYENVQWYLANSGEYVYSATPTVMDDTILTFAYYECSISETVQQYVEMCGQSTLTQITDDHDFGCDGYKSDITADTDYFISDLTVNVNSTSLTDATRINSMVMDATWENYDDSSITYSASYTIAGFVVPVTVTKTDAPPEYGFWTEVEDKEWDLYVKYISAEDKVGFYFTDPYQDDAEPFFTVAMDENTRNPFPVMIGENFYVACKYMPDRDFFPNLTVFYDNDDLAITRHIHINGDTLTYKILYGDDTEFTTVGLLANLSDHGDNTAYAGNENPSSILYSAVNYWEDWTNGEENYSAWLIALSDDSEILDSDGYLSIERNGVYTNGDWSYATATSSYVVENGKYTGVNIKGTYDSLYDLDKDFAFGTTYTESDSDYEEIFAFAIGPIDNGGGSGGSGLSPTLKTILSVIPLILTVGLVLGAVTYLRMKN